jgi:hypothetical protein
MPGVRPPYPSGVTIALAEPANTSWTTRRACVLPLSQGRHADSRRRVDDPACHDLGDVIAIWNKGSGCYAGLTYFEFLGRPDLFDPNQVVDHIGVFGQVFPGDPPAS